MTTAQLLALVTERKRLRGMLHKLAAAKGRAEYPEINQVQSEIHDFVMRPFDYDAREAPNRHWVVVASASLVSRFDNLSAIEYPETVWNCSINEVPSGAFAREVQLRILDLTAPLDYVIERDGLTE